MEKFEVGDRVVFQEVGSTEKTTGTVRRMEGILDDVPTYTVELDYEWDGSALWTVAHNELTKTVYVSFDTLMEGE